MKFLLNKALVVACSLIVILLTFVFIVGANYTSFQRSLNAFETSLVKKETIDNIKYKEIDFIFSKSNSEKVFKEGLKDEKGIYVFNNVPYILYGNKFFKADLDKNNKLLYDEKLASFYLFDVYKDILNILIMFTIGLITILFIKIRVKYLKFEEGFKSNYNLSVLNKNIYVELSFIILIIFILVKSFSLFVLNISSTHFSVLLFVLIYIGNIMFKEYKIRKSILLSKYESYLNNVKNDIEIENSKKEKALIKKYKNYNFKALLNNNDEVIDLKLFKKYLIENLIDIDNLSDYEKLKLVVEYKKLN